MRLNFPLTGGKYDLFKFILHILQWCPWMFVVTCIGKGHNWPFCSCLLLERTEWVSRCLGCNVVLTYFSVVWRNVVTVLWVMWKTSRVWWSTNYAVYVLQLRKSSSIYILCSIYPEGLYLAVVKHEELRQAWNVVWVWYIYYGLYLFMARQAVQRSVNGARRWASGVT